MGAGDSPQDDAESQLLRQAMDSGLGFSKTQLYSAVKYLVKTFGSSEEACKWIQQDNFTILVNYILDNADECEQSPEKRQGKRIKEKESNEVVKAGQGTIPDRRFLSLQQVDLVEMDELEPPQKIHRVDRNAFRLHHKRKVMESMSPDLPLDVLQKPEQIREEVEQPPLRVIERGVPLKMTASSKGQLKRRQDVNGPLKASRKTLRLAEIQDRKEAPESVCLGSSEKPVLSHPTEKGAWATIPEASCSALIEAEGFEIGTACDLQTTKRTKDSTADVSHTIEAADEEGNQNRNWQTRKGGRTTSIEASCSAAIEASHYEDIPNPTTCDFELQLEAFLKANNCEKALEVFRAWRSRGFKKEMIDGPRQCGGHEHMPDIPGKKRGFVVSYDVSRGLEKLPISCVNEYNSEMLPDNFLYITKSEIRAAAPLDTSLSRIGDLHCCCSDDCLRSPEACKCTDSTRGEYAYDHNGRLIERLATPFRSGCTTQNGDFITECCTKCRCSMNCGNRIVQRGITRKLQVFMTATKKGWGVRALEKIPAWSFLFEYLGEIATNEEQYARNQEYEKLGVHTYSMNLDADLDMEKNHFREGLSDTEALVLDAARFGNVSRFVNHRCNDANLFMRPVQIESRDTHYYHAAFFAMRDIEEMEELTWDYGIDFEDESHQLKAFVCRCKSRTCRDKRSPFNLKRGQALKPSRPKHSS